MADRTISLPAHPFRWLITPTALGTVAGLVATAIAWICRRTRDPALPRMSDEWLRNVDRYELH